MNADVLIVGQGLTGSLVASALEDRGYSVMIYDQKRAHSASQYAAGLINPVTGRRFVKSWNYDQLEEVFKKVYEDLGVKLQATVINTHKIKLCLSTAKEENDLLSQSTRYAYEHLLEIDRSNSLFKNNYVTYNLSGYKVDIINLILHCRNYWLNKERLIDEDFDYDSLTKVADKWCYQNNRYASIIFCEGADVKDNPFFKNMPIIPNKGQMMWVKMGGLPENTSLKHQLIVSSEKPYAWVGATYEWIFESNEPNAGGLEELKNKLNAFLSIPYSIISHHAGIRPTTADRRPIILQHAEEKSMWAINGMGTKGASLAPWIIKDFMVKFAT